MLLKLEWCGEGFIGLCSKTYFCHGGEQSVDKYSCKGIQKSLNKFGYKEYLDVLTNRVSGSGQNRGFRTVGSTMYTYSQNRHGLSYFYPKRKVLEDGVTTTYLDI